MISKTSGIFLLATLCTALGCSLDISVAPPWRLGAAESLEIVTWNLCNFPTDAQTGKRVAHLIEQMDVDLVAVQEVADQLGFERMLARLEGYQGVLSDHQYRPGEYQKTGFVYRTDFIRLQSVESLFVGDSYAFPRPPLQAEFVVERPDREKLSFLAIALHLKAFPDPDNQARRRAACERLKQHVDDILAAGFENQLVLLGDFNDRLDDPPQDNVFQVFLDQPEAYRFLTQEAAAKQAYSYIPSRDLIDHILMTSKLAAAFEPARTELLELEQLVTAYDFVEEVSDHRPVTAILPW